MPRRKKEEGAQPATCPECKESAEGVYKLAIYFGCDKHGMNKLGIRQMIQNQQASIASLNWYIDLAGPDIYLEVQRLAGEGDRRAQDVVMVRENK
jgi:hypothetical protein